MGADPVTTAPHDLNPPPLDTQAIPLDLQLLRNSPLADDLFRRWLPWCWKDGAVWIATCEPVTNQLRAEVSERLDEQQLEFRTVPFAVLADAARDVIPDRLAHVAAERFAETNPQFSAKSGLTWWQASLPAAVILIVIIGMIVNWRNTLVVCITAANVIFLLNVGFKVAAAGLRPFRATRERRIRQSEVERLRTNNLSDDDLPIYTVLVPVYQEANVIGEILRNFEKLDYPAEKLDIMVLLEADDTDTIAAAKAMKPPAHIRLLVVPPGEPRTKPRACNYGLLFARGEYVVIFDAEDRPDADQLRRVLASFGHATKIQARRGDRRRLACVQASLNYYNADYNVLTRMFAIEYAQWFDSMLPGMDSANTPIPLGGTSNHFLRSALEEVGGWDPYNVTEDADLGLRLAAVGYRVDVVASTTWEEATARVWPWITQRTRWTKGYLLTAAVNLRRPLRWFRTNGLRGTITMIGLIVGTPLAFLLYPLALGFTVAAWLIGPIIQIWLPSWLLIFGLINMVVMNLLMVVSSGIAAWQRYNWRIAAFAVFLPIYWLLHAIAAWRASIQMSYAPFRWEKTPHGLTEDYDDGTLDNHGLSHSAAG